jgi:hypothetical protein
MNAKACAWCKRTSQPMIMCAAFDGPVCADGRACSAHRDRIREGERADRIAAGEAVPGAAGACEACGHGKVWHSPTNRRRPCERCECRAYQGRTPSGRRVKDGPRDRHGLMAVPTPAREDGALFGPECVVGAGELAGQGSLFADGAS